MAEFYDLFHHADLQQHSPSNFEGRAPAGTFPDGTSPLASQHTDTLPIKGQGTIVVQSKAERMLSFNVKTDKEDLPTLHLIIGVKDYQFYYQQGETRVTIPAVQNKGPEAILLNPGEVTTYWLSIDQNNGLLRYGKYFPTKALTLLEARLKNANTTGTKSFEKGWEYQVRKVEAALPELKWTDDFWQWIGSLEKFDGEADKTPVPISSVAIGPLPVVVDLPPIVADPAKITLTDIEAGFVTAPINLPLACQELYGNIQGAGVTLDDDEFPFSAAIQHSINTPGCWAYEKLREKAKGGEFGVAIKGTYLRITLGYNLGNSPGIPYVMEIWPSGHYSPIHNHGQACAVIKVLHGEITCNWYSDLNHPAQIGAPMRVRKGGITWISPQNYQIHKLENKSHDVCVTIQCYRYAGKDNVHYDGFDYIKDGKVAKFTPNSDMAFMEFRKQMIEEWKWLMSPRLLQDD